MPGGDRRTPWEKAYNEARDEHCFRLKVNGLLYKQIAYRLGISEATVEVALRRHRKRIQNESN